MALTLVATYPAKLGKELSSFPECLGADFNGDGRLDLIEFDAAGRSVVWLGLPGAAFEPTTEYPTLGLGSSRTLPGFAAAEDFDGDGRVDLVVENPSNQEISIRMGTDSGLPSLRPGVPVERLLVADVDQDGHLDVIAPYGDGHGSLLGFVPWRGRGDGTLVRGERHALANDLFGSLQLQDWNHDGKPDALALGSNLHVLPGMGDGRFGPDQRCAVASPTLVADFDHDGWLDLFLAVREVGLTVLSGSGSCDFPPRVDIAIPAQSGTIGAGDISGDGLLDLVVTTSGGGLVVVAGHSDGRLLPQPEMRLALSATRLIVADVDDDGRPDLVATSPNGIQVFTNHCTQ